MAKYTITHSCGHTAEHQIYGTNTHGEREKRAAYLETTLCAECYARAQTGECNEVTMHYGEYKTNYSSCKTVPNSYDAKAKTIVVLVPMAVPAAEVTEAEAVDTLAEMGAPRHVAESIVKFTRQQIERRKSQHEGYANTQPTQEQRDENAIVLALMNYLLKIKITGRDTK